jgi:serine/threonine-protein kinase
MLQKDQLIGKYRIKELLGSGGFGKVYRAEDTWLKIPVAIKVPHDQHPKLDEMLCEARLLASLDHPNIVRVLNSEKTENVFYFVMEYVDGQSLESILEKEKTLPLDTFFDYIEKILGAVEYAHKKNILHRDLRPANILISKEGVLKIADFGISKDLQNAPFARTRVGSPPYMAPEQFLGRSVLVSDIYAIGVMMYEMLTGNLPIYDADINALQRKAAEGRVTPPEQKNKSIPQRLSRIILKAMAPKIEQRYPSAEELRKDLLNEGGVKGQYIQIQEIQERLRAKKTSSGVLCWNCRKPMHKKANVCMHCGEKQ